MNRNEKHALAAAVFSLSFIWNRDFLNWVSPEKILAMNDVGPILSGYRKVPNLFFDSGQWWTGTWIQEEISAFRPLASYLYWIESFIGLNWGFIWVGWIGIFLLAANALLAATLAWRLTKSKACVWLAAILGVALRFHNWGGATPDYWLAWFPVHQELLMNAWLLAAIICFDIWNETATMKYLASAWAFFVIGVLTKEHVYIFPAFALAIVQFRRDYNGAPAEISWRNGMLQVALMFACVFALWAYRAGILIDARNPQLKPIHFLRKPFLYVFYPFYKHILTEQFWFPGLAFLMFCVSGVLLRLKLNLRFQSLLKKPFAGPGVLGVVVAIIAIYCAQTYSIGNVFWYLFDLRSEGMHLLELPAMVFGFYAIWLLWKYRRTQPTALAFSFLVLAYLPIISYLGWHYTVAPWFVRCAYWALIAKLVWLDCAPILLPLFARVRLRFSRFGFEPLLQKR